MKIVKTINLNELKRGLNFKQLLSGLHPLKTYKRKKENKELQWVSLYSSHIEFQLENNEKVIMNLEEVLMDENLITNLTATFSNETNKLIISSNDVNTNLTYEYSELFSIKKDEMSLIEKMNVDWQEYVLENKFNNLIETDDEQSNDIFKELSFLHVDYTKSVQGSFSEFVNVVEHRVTINFKNIEAVIGAAPGYNPEFYKKNWFLSPYLDVGDSQDTLFQVKDGENFSEVFNLTNSQVNALNRMLTEFNLLAKTESEFINREMACLQNSIKSIQTFSNADVVISARFLSEGTEILVLEKENGTEVTRFTIFQDMLEM